MTSGKNTKKNHAKADSKGGFFSLIEKETVSKGGGIKSLF